MTGVDARLFERIQQAPNLTTGLIEALAERIVSGELLPGQRLPTEQAIVSATGVSRTVVREALASLRARGLIMTRQGLGAFVADDAVPTAERPVLTVGTVGALQILELRSAIEPEAAALAADRRSESEVQALRDAAEAVTVSINGGGSGEEPDYAFHHTILRATRNPFFVEVIKPLGAALINPPVVPPQAMTARARERYRQALQSEHLAILSAIAAQNAEAARRAARRHLIRGTARFRDALPEPS